MVLCKEYKYSSYNETSEQRTLWDQYKLKWFVPCIEVVLFKGFQLHYINRGIKFGNFVLSIVERYIHQGEVTPIDSVLTPATAVNNFDLNLGP